MCNRCGLPRRILTRPDAVCGKRRAMVVLPVARCRGAESIYKWRRYVLTFHSQRGTSLKTLCSIKGISVGQENQRNREDDREDVLALACRCFCHLFSFTWNRRFPETICRPVPGSQPRPPAQLLPVRGLRDPGVSTWAPGRCRGV